MGLNRIALVISVRSIISGLLLLQCGQAARGGSDLMFESRLNTDYGKQLLRRCKAAEMASFMDMSVHPCDNFYKFACGNFARINPANLERNKMTGLFETLERSLDRKVKRIFNSPDSALDTPEDVQVKNFYKSCLAVHDIDENYRQKLTAIIAEFGSMPILEGDAWQESQFDWLTTIGSIAHQYGLNIILSVAVDKDFANNTVNVIEITQQEFDLETRSMYLDTDNAEYRQIYRDRIAHTLETYLHLRSDNALKTATEILGFEVQLAQGLASENDDEQQTGLGGRTSFGEMRPAYTPTLDIERLVNISLGAHDQNYVFAMNPKYRRNLEKVIDRIPKSTMANYIFYQLIKPFFIKLGKSPVEQENACMDLTRKYFWKHLDKMIYRCFSNNRTELDVQLVWRELKVTFKEMLKSDKSLDWISHWTRQRAIEKLEAMKLQIDSHIGEKLAEDFDGLQLQRVDYVENLRQKLMKSAQLRREKLHQPAKQFEGESWISSTPVNILVDNVIRVPVMTLQPYYLWDASYPNALKFGTFAAVIAHELIHGFDDTGSRFDRRGNLHRWWDNRSSRHFVQRQNCFTEQYSHYSYFGRRLPKYSSQSENISDNGGIRLAYAAYRRWLSQAQQELDSDASGQLLVEERLPTLSYSNLQLFFISYAQIWCNDVHPSLHDYLIYTDEHVPGEFRVIGPLSNFEEFAKEFQCAANTRMNPAKKCKIY